MAKDPLFSLETLAAFDEEFTADFAAQLQDIAQHCRKFPLVFSQRKLFIEIGMAPTERDPMDQDITLQSSVKYPTVNSKVAKRRARSNRANQLTLDFDEDETNA
jgi:hypothetical protein